MLLSVVLLKKLFTILFCWYCCCFCIPYNLSTNPLIFSLSIPYKLSFFVYTLSANKFIIKSLYFLFYFFYNYFYLIPPPLPPLIIKDNLLSFSCLSFFNFSSCILFISFNFSSYTSTTYLSNCYCIDLTFIKYYFFLFLISSLCVYIFFFIFYLCANTICFIYSLTASFLPCS